MAEAAEAPAEQAPDTGAEAPAEPEAPTTPEGGDESPPDLGEAVAAMRQDIGEMKQRLPEQEPEEEVDLYEALAGEGEGEGGEEYEEGEPEGEYQEQYPDQPEGEYEGEEGEALAELNQMIDQRVQEMVGPVFQQQMEAENAKAIRAFADKHPELRTPEVRDEVAGRIEQLAEYYGMPAMRTDPAMVELAFKAYKAEAAASAETPAEEGGHEGATLEQGAGPGAPQEEADPVRDAFLGAIAGGSGNNEFTR